MRFQLKLKERAVALGEFSYNLARFTKYAVVNFKSFIQTQWRMSKLDGYGDVMGNHLRDNSYYGPKEIKYIDLESGETGIIDNVKVSDFKIITIVSKSQDIPIRGPYKREQTVDEFGRTVVTMFVQYEPLMEAHGDPQPVYNGDVDTTFPRLYKSLEEEIANETEMANAYLPEVVQNEPVTTPFHAECFHQVTYDDGHGHFGVKDGPEVIFPLSTKYDTPVTTGDTNPE